MNKRKEAYGFILRKIEQDGLIEKEKLIAEVCYTFLVPRRTALDYVQACSLGSGRLKEKINAETKEVWVEWDAK